jgi:hypothetical protein
LEETLGLYKNPRNRDELIRQMPYILRVSNGPWLRDMQEIWHAEIILNRKTKARLHWRPTEQRRGVALLAQRVSKKLVPVSSYREALIEKDSAHEILAEQRKMSSEMRSAIARGKKRLAIRDARKPIFEEFLRTHLNERAEAFIRKNLDPDGSRMIVQRWLRSPESYPYLSRFIEGLLYCDYYALVEHNSPIDINDRPDMALLTYLHSADILVSCDEQFQRKAFETLWAKRGKSLFTTSEFVSHIESF